jgi:hypothetical protein
MRLDLYNNKIGPQGSEHLGDMLAVNRTLIELDISQNSTLGAHVSYAIQNFKNLKNRYIY